MIKKLKNQPYASKWEQEIEKKVLYNVATNRYTSSKVVVGP
jgi:hypothetical protein